MRSPCPIADLSVGSVLSLARNWWNSVPISITSTGTRQHAYRICTIAIFRLLTLSLQHRIQFQGCSHSRTQASCLRRRLPAIPARNFDSENRHSPGNINSRQAVITGSYRFHPFVGRLAVNDVLPIFTATSWSMPNTES